MIDNIKLKFNSQESTETYLKSAGNYIQPSWIGKNENEKDREKTYPLKKKVNNIELRVTEKQSVLSNSLHKYFNISRYGEEHGNHNYNDFSYCDMLEALEELEQDFNGLNLNDGYLQSLEFGFNLLVEKPPRYYLEYNFLLYEHKEPSISKNTTGMTYKKFEHNNIGWKVYDKGTQYGLKKHLLRIEIIFGSKELKKLGIHTLNDLKNRNNILLLFSRFTEAFQKFTIVDSRFNKNDLSLEFINDLGNRLEPSYWNDKRGKSNIYRHKLKLKEMIEQKNLNTTEIYFTELIRNKFSELFYDCDTFRQVA